MSSSDSLSNKVAGVFSSSSPVEPERFAAGVGVLEALGFQVKVPLDPTAAYGREGYGFVSAPAVERVRSFEALLEDPEVDFLIAARGGYGAMEMLPLLDFDLLRRANKPIIGYSDVTALLIAAEPFLAGKAIHGPVVAREFADYSVKDSARTGVDSLLRLLQGAESELALEGSVIRDGRAEGRLIAGNLTMLQCLLGTPWAPNLNGAILVLEEVGEAPYRVERALLQLRLAGLLDGLAGLALGRFLRCSAAQGETIDKLFARLPELFANSSFPIIQGVPVGHEGLNYPLALGSHAKIEDGALLCNLCP